MHDNFGKLSGGTGFDVGDGKHPLAQEVSPLDGSEEKICFNSAVTLLRVTAFTRFTCSHWFPFFFWMLKHAGYILFIFSVVSNIYC